jgi:hypothetical protein
MKTKIKSSDAFKQIISKVNCTYGAPMGRPNVGKPPMTVTSGPNCKILKKNQVRIFDRYVRFVGGAYDFGGAYWGSPANLRVRYTADLSYVEFYRASN